MGKNEKLYQFLQENGVAALQTICYEKKVCSISNVVFQSVFLVRLLNNVTNYKRNRNSSKNGKLCTKIRKFCMKTGSTKSKKTFC